MKVRVTTKQVEVGEALPEKVRQQLETAIEKHFDRGAESNVVFSHEGIGFRVDCTTHLDSGVVLKSEGLASDAYHAFEIALDRMEKQIRRYKRRLKNHHEKTKEQKAAG